MQIYRKAPRIFIKLDRYSHLSSLFHSSWQAAWPAWRKWLLSRWCQFIARGLSCPPSPVPKGSPRRERDKSTTEETVLGLAHFCCWLVPCAPPAGLFEQPQLVEWSLAWLCRKRKLVRRNRLGTNLNGCSYEWTFRSDTLTASQNLTVSDEVDTVVISGAMICPFEDLSLEDWVSNIKTKYSTKIEG